MQKKLVRVGEERASLGNARTFGLKSSTLRSVKKVACADSSKIDLAHLLDTYSD